MSHDPSEIKHADFSLRCFNIFTVNFNAFLMNKNINFTRIHIYFIRLEYFLDACCVHIRGLKGLIQISSRVKITFI